MNILKRCILGFLIVYGIVYPNALQAGLNPSEPLLKDVVQAALEENFVDREEIKAWQKRIRKSYWLPTLYLGVDHAFREVQGTSWQDQISVTSGGVVVGPPEEDGDYQFNHQTTFRARAVWNLGQIVFSKELFQWEKLHRLQGIERVKFVQLVTKIYQERKKLLSLISPGNHHRMPAHLHDLIQEKTVLLNELTGGRFRSLWKRSS